MFKFAGLKFKIMISIISVLTIGIGVIGWVAFAITEKGVIENAYLVMTKELQQKVHAIQMFHDKAQSNLLFVMGNTLFKEYFSLMDVRACSGWQSFGRQWRHSIHRKTEKDQEQDGTVGAFFRGVFPLWSTVLSTSPDRNIYGSPLGRSLPMMSFPAQRIRSPFSNTPSH